MASRITFAYIQKSHVFMRELPENHSKVVSDALYGEEITVNEEREGWRKITTQSDGYQGWVRQTDIIILDTDFFGGCSIVKIDRLKAHIYAEQDTEFGRVLSLPYGCRLKVREDNPQQKRWMTVTLIDGREGFVQRGDIRKDNKHLSKQEMIALSHRFLDVPYAWGGRSSFGFDCSGFVQMLYQRMGVQIPRDSKDQCKWDGFKSVSLEDIEAGDLIFFGPKEDKICHVGMSLGGSRFINATVRESKPYIHISNLKDEDWNGKGTLAFRTARGLKQSNAQSEAHYLKSLYGVTFGIVMMVVTRVLSKN